MEGAILNRSADDLSPIEVPAPAEVAVLVDAVNRFMRRLERRINEMEAFVADAAHQMRTPITALRAQAQLALDEKDPEKLERLHERIYRRSVGLGRLADQLLSRALISHRADSAAHEVLDLRKVAVEAEREMRAIGNRAIEIDLPDDELLIKGDEVSLREAIKNLLNNALRHGADPVRLSVGMAESGAPRVLVHDAGSGIPEDRRARIGDRFSSDGISAESAGLGLSIVSVVAGSHGAHLILRDPPAGGFEIGLEFPTADR
jgi:two-component system, OmpR family, sensor histidine kinase TctE